MAVKSTGIIRRIDPLNRIVIPKDVCEQLHWEKGDSLEIYLDKDAGVVLKKFEPALGAQPDAENAPG